MVQRDFQQAQAAVAKARPQAYYGLAAAHHHLGRVEDQVHSLGKAVQLNPAFAPAQRNLGALYIQLEEYAAVAEDALRLARAHDPGSAITHRHLAELYLRSGRRTQAQAALATAHRLQAASGR